MNNLFKDFLVLSDKLRVGYSNSLGTPSKSWERIFENFLPEIPTIYKTIYSNVSGTVRNIEDQSLMDFIPGYRLIHISEFVKEKKNLNDILLHYENPEGVFFPILVNYSNDFVCYHNNGKGAENICLIFHDNNEIVILHESAEKFFETVCEFYKQGVYFIDNDGYLDYDMEKESDIGSNLNPGVKYWTE